MSSTRTRGITVQRVDLTEVRESLTAQIVEARPDEGITGVTLGIGNFAIAERNGRTYVLCDEGVGSEVTADKPLVLDVYLQQGEGSFALFPSYSVTLPLERVQGLPKGEQVDLADFIRSFGARLESNFRNWANALTA